MASRLPHETRPETPGMRKKYIVIDIWDDAIEEDEVLSIYRWLDSLEFSRTKKTMVNRDFADGVMMAELVAHHIPKIIYSGYYIHTSSLSKKIDNWEHLNAKVFRRVGFQLTPDLVKDLAGARPGMIEIVLKHLQPILLQGQKAVIPLSKRLENVRPRFMDFDHKRSQNKQGRPKTAESKSISRQSFRPVTAGPTFPQVTPLEIEVIKDPRNHFPIIPDEVTVTSEPLSSENSKLGGNSGENYEILVRPSTATSWHDEATSANLVIAKENTVDYQDENSNTSISSNQRALPIRSSWLPLEETDTLDAGSVGVASLVVTGASSTANALRDSESVKDSANDLNNNPLEADEEIDCCCDPSGYDEDTEGDENDEVNLDNDDPVFIPSSGDSTRRPRRKLKRVIKYEYREEYILNGMASYQLPNRTQLENVRKNYMNQGNTDPNCRGYGFV